MGTSPALVVHAWIYALDDGLLRDFGFAVGGPEELQRAFETAVRTRPLAAPVPRR